MARRISVVGLLLVCALVLVPAASADAAQGTPRITKVSPLIVEVGRPLYIRGRNLEGAGTTIVFQRSGGRSVFVRAQRAGRNRLRVRVPGRIQELLTRDEAGTWQPTTFRLRAVTRRAGPLTRGARLSPVVRPRAGGAAPVNDADCDEDGTPNSSDPDDDNDALVDALDERAGLDPCRADTDGDAMEDGWEYWSAKDLNHKAIPYPGKKPYPNPLDASDPGIDFDGDSLLSLEEHNLWRRTGEVFDATRSAPTDLSSPLAYSDGTQTSRPEEVPAVPQFRSAEYGRPFTPPPYPAWYDRRPDGIWSDDERDADVDGLGNYVETHGPALQAWWRAVFAEDDIEPWPEYIQMTDEGPESKGRYFGEFKQRPFADPDYVDPDSDGDTLLDAEDDQDNDDWPNVAEMEYPHTVQSRDEDGVPATRQVNPFNPCAPDGQSRTCPIYRPIGGSG